jgi:quercetin dioxygenase-like cupin family protein
LLLVLAPWPGEGHPGARDTSDILKRGKRSCDYSARMGRPLIGEATWSASSEGERLWFVGTLATIRVPGEAVGGRYALIEFLFPKHASPPRHTHPQDESYIVIEGHLTVHAGGHRFGLETGGAATVPMGVPHTFRVDSETARVLVLSTPAGLERFVRDGGFPATAATLPPACDVRLNGESSSSRSPERHARGGRVPRGACSSQPVACADRG